MHVVHCGYTESSPVSTGTWIDHLLTGGAISGCADGNWFPIMKVRDVIRILREHGFKLTRQRGSHRHFAGFYDQQRRLVTVPGTDGEELPKGTLAAIRRQSGLPRRLFRKGKTR